MSNQSSFDLQIGYIQEIITVANQDNQRIEGDIRRAREELQQLRIMIENKNQSCIRELMPRIEQLQQKIQFYWEGIRKMNEVSWKDLESEDAILAECQAFVKKLDERIDIAQGKI